MINSIQLLRNVGQFENVSSSRTISLGNLVLVYAENGRGKTTLAAILRSLGTGDPIPVRERRRLAAQQPPHIVISCNDGTASATAMFQDDNWNLSLLNVAMFDEVFVDENIYSGLSVDSEHRKKLHELILGAAGVALNRRLQQLVSRIETHISSLRTRSSAIPASERGRLSADEFCNLMPQADIDETIRLHEQTLAAAGEQDAIRRALSFREIALPNLGVQEIDNLLQRSLPSVSAEAVEKVQAHFAHLGDGGESWISDGIHFLRPSDLTSDVECPFCAQIIDTSPVVNFFREYFGQPYTELKNAISEGLQSLLINHGGDAQVTFERAIREAVEQRQFWSRFCDVPEVTLDTARIVGDWTAAREAISTALRTKQNMPLSPNSLSPTTREFVTEYENRRREVQSLNERLQQTNILIQGVKDRVETTNPLALSEELAVLKATRSRHTSEMARLCSEYFAEKVAKEETERLRDQTRSELDQHRQTIFPRYKDAINRYLHRFNAGFRLDEMESSNTRAGSTCNYNVVINNTPVPVGGTGTPGEPSFKTTLSAGDRSTLALAFFMASLELDPNTGNKIVIIDDPVSSMDDHRLLTTVQEIRNLGTRVRQLIVLSHSKSLLCGIWGSPPLAGSVALQLTRDTVGSTISSWDVNQDKVTEHDRRHAVLRTYMAANLPNIRDAAEAIRPVLEAYVRVSCPEHFPPGSLLGPFLGICDQRVGTLNEILNAQRIQELRSILEYANRFHHDTNPAYQTASVNDGELQGFVSQTLEFTSP